LKVLVIPEDPALDQYILKPVVERIFADLGRRARIDVLANPRLRGVAQALDATVIAGVVDMYRMIDLFLLIVDRDSVETRAGVAAAREQDHPDRLIACLAIEEIEVWMLAIHHEAIPLPWGEVRSERNVKERIARPFLAERAPRYAVGVGRAWAMRDLGAQWRGVLARCPELEDLKQRIGGWMDGRATLRQ
jgi:hypothetical protein